MRVVRFVRGGHKLGHAEKLVRSCRPAPRTAVAHCRTSVSVHTFARDAAMHGAAHRGPGVHHDGPFGGGKRPRGCVWSALIQPTRLFGAMVSRMYLCTLVPPVCSRADTQQQTGGLRRALPAPAPRTPPTTHPQHPRHPPTHH